MENSKVNVNIKTESLAELSIKRENFQDSLSSFLCPIHDTSKSNHEEFKEDTKVNHLIYIDDLKL